MKEKRVFEASDRLQHMRYKRNSLKIAVNVLYLGGESDADTNRRKTANIASILASYN